MKKKICLNPNYRQLGTGGRTARESGFWETGSGLLAGPGWSSLNFSKARISTVTSSD
jgi:hypothetical protein